MRKPTPEQIIAWVKANFTNYKIRNDEILLPNPFYHNDKLKLGLSISKAVMHDWRTPEFNMTFIKFVMKYKKLSWRQAWKEVTGINFVPSNFKKEEKESIQQEIQLPEGSYPIIDNTIPQLRKAVINYMYSRGINYDTLVKYNIYYNIEPIVIFPYIEWGHLVYWQSRSIIDKIFNFAKGTSKNKYIFGLDNCDIHNIIIIVESAINAMSIDHNSIAISGSSISEIQISKLKLLDPTKIILAPDNDQAGRNFIKKAFFDGEDPESLLGRSAPAPTIGLAHYVYSWLDAEVGIIDSAGQEFDQYVSQLSTFERKIAFEEADVVIYVFDVSNWQEQYLLVLENLEKILKAKDRYNTQCKIYAFCHKIDLVSSAYSNSSKEIPLFIQIRREIEEKYKIKVIFTSIEPTLIHTLYRSMQIILNEMSVLGDSIETLSQEILRDQKKSAILLFSDSNTVINQ